MSENNIKIIKMIGALFITVGSLQLIFRVKGIWWSLQALFRPSSFISTQEYLLLSFTSILFLFLLPLAILIAGFGLIRIKKWGWLLALSVSIVTFLLSSYGSINFAIESYKFRNMPMPKIPEGAHVIIVSIWPTFIYVIVSALLILILKRQSLRQEFNNLKK